MNIKSARINGIELSVCGADELPDFEGRGVTHVISVWDGYEADNPMPRALIGTLFPEALAFFGFFDDVTHEFCGDFAPARDLIQRILDFTRALAKGDYLLVHCGYGVSRSTAIAFAALCQHAGPGLEQKCLGALMKIRPIAAPNPLIVRFADELMGIRGSMHGTLKSWKAAELS